MICKRGQVWVETVIYTLIGLAIIGLVLAAALPKINARKDEIMIEQSIEALGTIDDKIYEVINGGVGNRRVIDLDVKRGKLIIDMEEDTIYWELDSGFEYSETGVTIPLGKLNVTTTSSDPWKVKLELFYGVDLRFDGDNFGTRMIDVSPTPYKFIVENAGREDGKIVINLGEDSIRDLGLDGGSVPEEPEEPGTTYEIPTSGLISWWKFDESSGTVASDSAGTNDGTLNNMEDGDWVVGKSGNALDFDGVNEYVSIPFVRLASQVEDMTFSAWVYCDGVNSASSLQGIVSIMGGDDNAQNLLSLSDTATEVFAQSILAGGSAASGDVGFSQVQWVHVVGVFDTEGTTSTNTSIYVDGALASSGQGAGAYSYSADTLKIGMYKIFMNRYFNGMIDDVMIYDRVLSEDDVSNIYEVQRT